MKIVIAADHAGFRLKEKIEERLRGAGHEVIDRGTDSDQSVDYPGYALMVARMVAAGEAQRGILVCGTGIGMCIVANKVDGIRAVGPGTPYQAEMSRRHNDANVLCLGARTMDEAAVFEIMDVWLATQFEGGRHAERLDQITDFEKNSG